ncbi:hypothetical protein [Desulfosediminicola ganghwensis]|uniref:hypothetical protein n=1 Tax=Desulfosediminicola ganghwensis TaxID=2569540 RepID=UPI0010AC71EA|nr:hypothetical protein [Desulfosediminicola ganghwensis]
MRLKQNKDFLETILREAGESWPTTFIARKEVPKFTGGMIAANTLRNRDSQGTGPDGKFQLGKQVGYPVDNLIDWLLENYQGGNC